MREPFLYKKPVKGKKDGANYIIIYYDSHVTYDDKGAPSINYIKRSLSTGTPAKAKANEFLREWKEKRDGHRTNKPLYLDELITEALICIKSNKSDKYYLSCKSTYERLLDFLKNIPVHLIKSKMIEDYKRMRETSYKRYSKTEFVSKTSINVELRNIRRLFNLALELEMMENFHINIFLYDIQEEKPRAFTREEKLLLINAPKYHNMHDILLFALNSGCRLNEILNVKVEHIDLANREITIPKTKNKKSKIVEINDSLYEMLRNRLNKDNILPMPGEYLFHPIKENKPYNLSYVSKHFKKIMRSLNFPESYKFHSTRHTVGTELSNSNVPIHIIKGVLGHADLRSTMVYMHDSKEEKQKAMGKLNKN